MIETFVFYPPEAKSAGDRFRYDASRFVVVSVDATCYRLPMTATSQRCVD